MTNGLWMNISLCTVLVPYNPLSGLWYNPFAALMPCNPPFNRRAEPVGTGVWMMGGGGACAVLVLCNLLSGFVSTHALSWANRMTNGLWMNISLCAVLCQST